MSSKRLSIAGTVLCLALIGCGGGAEPKKYAAPDPAQKTELDKQHAEMKAKAEPQSSTPAK
jgi:hypothetical protein